MSEDKTNLRVMKRSRNMPHRGDVFAMKLPDDTYIFGRIIGAELEPPRAPMVHSYLIYVYDERATSLTPDLAQLRPDRLLLPPVFINRMPWSKGYFQTVATSSLEADDLLARHCFWSAARDGYVDENGVSLRRASEPCGDWALSSYRWLDDRISDALGIPRVLED